jgi:chaperonin GroES
MSKLQPLNGTVVLKKVEEGEQRYGDIVLPDMGKEKPEMGDVVAVSDGTYNWHTDKFVKPSVSVGDRVLIPKMGSMNFSIDSEDYVMIKETDILAIIKN